MQSILSLIRPSKIIYQILNHAFGQWEQNNVAIQKKKLKKVLDSIILRSFGGKYSKQKMLKLAQKFINLITSII